MDALARGAEGTAEHAGNLLDRQVEVVIKGERQQVMLRQPVECCIEVDAFGPPTF